MTRNDLPAVTIAVFSRDEDATLEEVVDGIRAAYPAGRIVLVVNALTECVQRLSRENGLAVLKDNGKGKGAAIRMAIERAEGGILVLMDADGSHDAKDIPRLVRPLLEDRAEMVVASRLKGGSEEFSGSVENYVHLLGNYLSSLAIGLIWGRKGNRISDCLNGFRAVKTDAAKKLGLREDEFAIEQEMVIRCYKNGLRLREAPSFEFKRKSGVSHIRKFSNFIQCSRCILRNMAE